MYTFKVIHAFPHDPNAYTQGLAYRDFLYEGTGLNGRSSLRKVRLETGEVVQRVDLAPEYFGEGIALIKNEIVQLTWKSGTGFVYNAENFSLLRKFTYAGEGWGLTTNGSELFLSDGTDEIRVLDGSSFKEKRRLKVRDGETAITQLNELEWVEGELFANVWHSDRIARISPRGQSDRMDRLGRPAQPDLPARSRGGVERDRLRRRGEAAVRDGQAVAKRV